MIQSLRESWAGFWFKPQPTSTLAIVRIAYGFVVLGWAGTLAPDILNFYSPTGVLPEESPFRFRYGVFDLWNSDILAVAVIALLIVAAASLVVGYRTRLAAVVIFVLLLSLRDRNPWHFSGGDALIRHLGFFMMFAPAGAALSIDRWRRAAGRIWEFPQRAPWALRLMQLQIAAVYLFTVWAKAEGAQWWDGTASGNVMHVADLARFSVPQWVQGSLLISNVVTWGTLAVELALGVLIWNRRARPYVIVAGLFLHLFIELTMQLGFFSAVMVMGYATFIPEDTALRWLGRVRHGLRRSSSTLLRWLADPPASAARTGARPDERTLPVAPRIGDGV